MTRAEAIKVITVLVVSRKGKVDLRIVESLLSELEKDIILEEGDTMETAYEISCVEDSLDFEEILEGNLECLKDSKAGKMTLDVYSSVETLLSAIE